MAKRRKFTPEFKAEVVLENNEINERMPQQRKECEDVYSTIQ